MNRLFRLYNQNRHMFWLIVVIVIMAFALIRTLNNYAKQQRISGSSIDTTTTYYTSTLNPNYSVISGYAVDKNEVEPITTVISSFLEFCNLRRCKKCI